VPDVPVIRAPGGIVTVWQRLRFIRCCERGSAAAPL
jgi:hypothetical protein